MALVECPPDTLNNRIDVQKSVLRPLDGSRIALLTQLLDAYSTDPHFRLALSSLSLKALAEMAAEARSGDTAALKHLDRELCIGLRRLALEWAVHPR